MGILLTLTAARLQGVFTSRHRVAPPSPPGRRRRRRADRSPHERTERAERDMSSPSLPAVKELGPNHVCLDQTDANVAAIAAALPWYGPKHSPHDVPSFYDVSGITENPAVFRMVVDFFVQRYRAQGPTQGPTHIAGFDARGFLFGPPIALALDLPFVMIRKAGKLPGVLVSSGAYVTEYSTDETVMRLGSVTKGDRVVLIDDLIATGGTALAGFDLVASLGASVHEFAAMVSLPFLDGVGKIHAYKNGKFKDVPCFTMVDDATIGPEMCADPPEGTPRVVKAEEAAEWAAKIAKAAK